MWNLEAEECNVIKNINYAKRLYDLQKEKVIAEQYIENLLLEDYVRKIKQNISRYDYVDFNSAQKEVSEKAKSKRKNVEMLKHMMLDDFLNNDENFKLTHIMSCGYDNYAWAIEFEGYGKIFRIDIPIMKNLSAENIGYAKNGMFAFTIKDTQSSWAVLKRSYKIKDIADYIKNYFLWTNGDEQF